MRKYYQVSGNSMYPTLKDGDVVELVSEQYSDREIVIFIYENKLYVKRLIGEWLLGDNKETSINFKVNEVEILGSVEKIERINDNILFIQKVFALDWETVTSTVKSIGNSQITYGYYNYGSGNSGYQTTGLSVPESQFDFSLYDYRFVYSRQGAPSSYLSITYKMQPINYNITMVGSDIEISLQRLRRNSVPTLSLKTPNNQIISEGNTLNKYNNENFSFKITASDNDASDTLEYTILLNSTTIQPYTTCQKGVEFTYTIPSSSFLIGNNAIQVKVKDSNGAETSISFTINNQQPPTWKPTAYTCLNDLKPADYNKTTISLGEIIEFLNNQP